jgi:hypothetical protein
MYEGIHHLMVCPPLPGASAVSPLPREAWAMLHSLNDLNVGNYPAFIHKFFFLFLDFAYRNVE